MQGRARRIGHLLRSVPTLLPRSTTRKEKRRGAWVILVQEPDGESCVAVTYNIYTPGRTVEQLVAPIPVTVHRPDLVDPARLRQLEQRGVAVVVTELRTTP